MHPVITLKSWNHHLHDGMIMLWHHIEEHLRSRHFWVGVVITLFIVGLLTTLYILAKNAPFVYPPEHMYLPYGM